MLIVQSRDDRLCDGHRLEAWDEEAEERIRGDPDGGEQRCHDMAGNEKGGANLWCVVLVVEFVAQRFVEGDERRLGGVVVGCRGNKYLTNRWPDETYSFVPCPQFRR